MEMIWHQSKGKNFNNLGAISLFNSVDFMPLECSGLNLVKMNRQSRRLLQSDESDGIQETEAIGIGRKDISFINASIVDMAVF